MTDTPVTIILGPYEMVGKIHGNCTQLHTNPAFGNLRDKNDFVFLTLD